MAYGGIYDQIGGGFARYSTDGNWKIPHFEKMLYDNGQLVSLYSEAFLKFKKPLYRDVVFQTLDFVERELMSLMETLNIIADICYYFFCHTIAKDKS